MSASIAFHCDICGTEKKETNHWWMILTGEEHSKIQFEGQSGEVPDRRFLVVPWQAEMVTRPGVHHACGQLCVLRGMERFMSGDEIFPEPMDFSALINSVAESAVLSAMDADFPGPSRTLAAPMAVDADELGELSAVLSPAQPKLMRSRKSSDPDHLSAA